MQSKDSTIVKDDKKKGDGVKPRRLAESIETTSQARASQRNNRDRSEQNRLLESPKYA